MSADSDLTYRGGGSASPSDSPRVAAPLLKGSSSKQEEINSRRYEGDVDDVAVPECCRSFCSAASLATGIALLLGFAIYAALVGSNYRMELDAGYDYPASIAVPIVLVVPLAFLIAYLLYSTRSSKVVEDQDNWKKSASLFHPKFHSLYLSAIVASAFMGVLVICAIGKRLHISSFYVGRTAFSGVDARFSPAILYPMNKAAAYSFQYPVFIQQDTGGRAWTNKQNTTWVCIAPITHSVLQNQALVYYWSVIMDDPCCLSSDPDNWKCPQWSGRMTNFTSNDLITRPNQAVGVVVPNGWDDIVAPSVIRALPEAVKMAGRTSPNDISVTATNAYVFWKAGPGVADNYMYLGWYRARLAYLVGLFAWMLLALAIHFAFQKFL